MLGVVNRKVLLAGASASALVIALHANDALAASFQTYTPGTGGTQNVTATIAGAGAGDNAFNITGAGAGSYTSTITAAGSATGNTAGAGVLIDNTAGDLALSILAGGSATGGSAGPGVKVTSVAGSAQTLTINNAGSISGGTAGVGISAAVDATAAQHTLSIANSGTITGTGANAGVKIAPANATSNALNILTMTAGTITGGANAAGYGIEIDTAAAGGAVAKDKTTISLSGGTITGGTGAGAGIKLVGGGTAQTVSISVSGGVIQGTTAGATAIDLSAGNAANVENVAISAGTITGGSATNTAIALKGGSGGSAVNITGGTVTGKITTGTAGTGNVTINGTFTAGGDLGVSGTRLGTVQVAGGTVGLGYNVYATTVDINGGTTTLSTSINGESGRTLQLSGGTLSLGTNSFTFAGAPTIQSATAASTLNTTIGSTANGKIDMSAGAGTVNVATATADINVKPTISGLAVKNGDRFVVVDNNAGTTLTATNGFKVASGANTSLVTWSIGVASSAGTDAYGTTTITNGKDIVLTAAVASASSVVPGLSTSAASSVNTLTAYSGTNTQLNTLAASIENSSTSEIAKAGEQLRPSINGASIEGANAATSGALNTVGSHLNEIRLAQSGGTGVSTGEAMRGLGVWGQGFGGYADQGTRNSVDGFTADTWGMALGGDAKVSERVRVGLAGSWARTNVADTGATNGNTTRINSYQATLYASYTGSPWYLDGNLAYTRHQYDTKRLVNAAGISDTATGSHDGNQYTVSADGGYPVKVGSMVLTPTVGIAYSRLNQDGYTESSTAGTALTLGSVDSDSLKSTLGGKIGRTFVADEYKISPEFRAAWQHEYLASDINQTTQFAAGGSSFTATTDKPAADAALLGVGVDIANTNNFTVTARYDAEIKEAYVGHTGLLQLRKDF